MESQSQDAHDQGITERPSPEELVLRVQRRREEAHSLREKTERMLRELHLKLNDLENAATTQEANKEHQKQGLREPI